MAKSCVVNDTGCPATTGDERIGRLRDEVGRLREELSRRERENDRQKRQIDATPGRASEAGDRAPGGSFARRAGFRQAAPFAKDRPQHAAGVPVDGWCAYGQGVPPAPGTG